MLILKGITKDYTAGDTHVQALKGIDITFRENEFVSILGPSGCGKTTLLNIIGGLDRYTDGDLSINGKSTKEFKSSDWDTYRNHSIGFVFQNYNLIPHQTVLANVELALTLSGVSKTERRKRAIDVLKQVGLGDQIYKKPNQMSGGQMQRVAIARALINDPDILLADEPTGALDSTTSVQIMDLLKSISKDKLIIMVTHNPELAEQYSSRIIRLLDGKITSDSNPYEAGSEAEQPSSAKKSHKTSMSFFTALSLSLNNLMTKKARTFLTSFAGSIGIIGIALILSISTGVQDYIDRVQEDTLSSYPLVIEETTSDVGQMMTSIMETQAKELDHDLDKVYSNNTMSQLLNNMLKELVNNDLGAFKAFIENDANGVAELCTDIKYGYRTVLNIYSADTSNGVLQVNPSNVFSSMGGMSGGGNTEMASTMASMSSMSGTNVWTELLGNEELLASQYDVLAGRMPSAYNEVIIVVDQNNEISDYTLYSLGLKDPDEVPKIMQDLMRGKEIDTEQLVFTYDELLALEFKLLPNSAYFKQVGDVWVDMRADEAYMKEVLDEADTVKVVGILRPSEDSSTGPTAGFVGYTSALMTHLIEQINESEIVQKQLADDTIDVFTNLPFETEDAPAPSFDFSTLSEEQQAYIMSLSEEERNALIESYMASMPSTSATYDGNLTILGVSDIDKPSTISLYPKDFEAKELIKEKIDAYNEQMRADDKEESVLQYTDYIGLMMSSVTSIINAISYVLIAFVGISLVVSSIMIGIITYISVLERTKEIGILRSIGASKKDISRVFNAETLIVGFVAGALGIGISLLLTIPINAIIGILTDVPMRATLPVVGGVILVAISMFLTFIAGLIPSRIAAKKDPVVALRTE